MAPPVPVPASPPRSIGVVALDGSDTATELAYAVSTRLGRTRDVRLIDSRELRSLWEQGGTAAVVSHLATAEDGCDSLVISLMSGREEEGDDLEVAVLRQTDLVVGVAASDGHPDQRTLAALQRARRPVSLALVQANGRSPAGTLRWLEAVARHTEIRSRIQLRAGNGRDLDRLARTVVGCSIGVVLGGGGTAGSPTSGSCAPWRRRVSPSTSSAVRAWAPSSVPSSPWA